VGRLKRIYLNILAYEKEHKAKNGLYDYLMVNLAYNTNRIEGSTLTLSDIESLYAHDHVPTGGHKMDDLIESRNHFELFDFMLETIEEPFNARLIKEYHQLLKKGTTDDQWYGVGQYKSIPNTIGEKQVAQPHEVNELMQKLINDFNKNLAITLSDILTFHYQFEMIHPFQQDGNGRIGRIIMLRQALFNDITPFMIDARRRDEYIEGLDQFEHSPQLLLNEATMQQEKFKKIAKPFVEHYTDKFEKM